MSGALVREWRRKAEEDYRAVLALDPEDVPDVVCFHCQQCAEKLLKAHMVRLGMAPPRTHDLAALVDAIGVRLPGIAVIDDDLELLNHYSVAERYPGESALSGDARDAVRAMERARSFLVKGLGRP